MIDYEYHRAYDKERTRVRKRRTLCCLRERGKIEGRKYGVKCKARSAGYYRAKMLETRMLAFVITDDRAAWQDWSRQHMEWHQKIYTEAVNQGFKKYEIFSADPRHGRLGRLGVFS